MANQSIATAYVDIKVNNAQVQQDFNQTRAKLTANAGLISKQFHKNFQAMTSSAIMASRKIRQALNIAFTPMLTGAGFAVKKFMDSTGGENAKRQWMETKKALDAAFARIGGMIWQSKLFGKTIEGWIISLTKFLNSLTSKDIARFTGTMQTLAKMMLALKGGEIVIGLSKATEKLLYLLTASSGVGAGAGVLNAIKPFQSTYYSGIPKVSGAQIGAAGFGGASATAISNSKLLLGFIKKLTGIITLIIAALSVITGLFKGLFRFSEMKNIIDTTIDIVTYAFKGIEEFFNVISLGFELIGGSIRSIFSNDTWMQNMNRIISNYEKGFNERWNPNSTTNPDSTPLSTKIVDDLTAQFNALISEHYDYIKKLQSIRKTIEEALKNTTDLENAEKLRMQLESIGESLSTATKLFGKQFDDFKRRMQASDEITQKSESFKELEKYIDQMTELLSRIGEDTKDAIEKTMKDIETAMDKMRVERKYNKEKAKLEEDLAKATADVQDKIAKVKAEMAKGLGFSGETVGLQEGATFAAKVQFDWQKQLLEWNKEIAEINKEGNGKLDEIKKEIQQQNQNWQKFNELLKKGFGPDFSEEMAF